MHSTWYIIKAQEILFEPGSAAPAGFPTRLVIRIEGASLLQFQHLNTRIDARLLLQHQQLQRQWSASLTAERGPRALHTFMVNSQHNPPKGGFSIPILQIKERELNTRPSQLDYQAPGPNIYPTPKSMLYYTILSRGHERGSLKVF